MDHDVTIAFSLHFPGALTSELFEAQRRRLVCWVLMESIMRGSGGYGRCMSPLVRRRTHDIYEQGRVIVDGERQRLQLILREIGV